MALMTHRLIGPKVAALGLVFSVCAEFVVVREEKPHIELPSYPEVHGEGFEAVISTATATVTHFRYFDLPGGPD